MHILLTGATALGLRATVEKGPFPGVLNLWHGPVSEQTAEKGS